MTLYLRATVIVTAAMLLSAAIDCAAQIVYDEGGAPDVVILDEDFDGCTAGSMDNISYGGDIGDVTASAGWNASAIGMCAGNFVFAPSLTPVTLTTPPVKVSQNAPLAVLLTMAEYNNERYYSGAAVSVSLLASDGSVAGMRTATLTEAGYVVCDISFDAPMPSPTVRVMINYDNGRSNRKLFLDRITLRQAGDASVGNVTYERPGAWVSAPGEITVSGTRAKLFSVDGRCLYDGASAILQVKCRPVIAVVDGVAVKLMP